MKLLLIILLASSSSLPLLSPSDEKEQQSHPRQTPAVNQSYMHTEEHRFVQSEIDNDDEVDRNRVHEFMKSEL